MKKKITTEQLVIMAFLIALEIVLTRLLSINLPTTRIGFGFLPIAFCAILFGPYWAALCYAIGDIIGASIFMPPPFPGFTVSAAITGLIYGFIFYNKPVTTKRSFVASLLILIPISLCLNTFWLQIIVGKGFLVLLPTRLLQVAILIPIQTLTIPLLWNKLFSKVPYLTKNSISKSI
ncbi:MAG: folate family ECF transporter S component [Anaerovoracaceae bacterium]